MLFLQSGDHHVASGEGFNLWSLSRLVRLSSNPPGRSNDADLAAMNEQGDLRESARRFAAQAGLWVVVAAGMFQVECALVVR